MEQGQGWTVLQYSGQPSHDTAGAGQQERAQGRAERAGSRLGAGSAGAGRAGRARGACVLDVQGARGRWACVGRAGVGRRRAARHGRGERWRALGKASWRAGVGGSDRRGARQAQVGARWAACARLVCAAGPGWVFWCT